MALTREQRLAIIDFLVPLLSDEGTRRTHFDLLFAGEPNRPDLDLRGAPRETTTRIVLKLETYSIEPGKPALVDLLDQVSHDVGIDHQVHIHTWKAALYEVSEPLWSPPNALAPSISPEHLQELASTPISRAEQFSLPAPFEWITIPAGEVTLEGKNESYLKQPEAFDVPAFGIGKYPITNAQFWRFIEADGYNNKAFWMKKGRRRPAWGSLLADKNYPVTVTWYEAMAFCAWLRETIGAPVYLPTEQQWQRAAQGDDGRIYPWGDKWEPENSNNSLNGSTSFTTIDEYEWKGNSPYGVVDMIGNAAEWTSTNWKTGKQRDQTEDARVVRGGSYQNEHLNFYRVTTRHKEWPTAECGFRIVRLLDT